MDNFTRKLQLRWSDLDPNGHVRHSIYYDFAAQVRTDIFIKLGMKPTDMLKAGFGPVLFEEKATFVKEIHYGDSLQMDTELLSLRKDHSRFFIRHRLWRGETVCAEVEVKGGLLDLKTRKLTTPSEEFVAKMKDFPKSIDFVWDRI